MVRASVCLQAMAGMGRHGHAGAVSRQADKGRQAGRQERAGFADNGRQALAFAYEVVIDF